MTFRELSKYLEKLTATQLDSDIFVELGDNFYRVEEGLNIASGDGLYLYNGEVYLSAKEKQVEEKDFDDPE